MGELQQVQANGLSQCVELAGPADRPAVVLAHSLACTHEMWRRQIEALSDSYRVVAYDLRGHGATSAPPGPYSLELLAADVLGLAEALSLERFHFVGLSIGGMIGQQLALTAPDRLVSLTLCATTSRIPPEGRKAFDERIAIAESQGMAALVEPTLARWFTEPFRAKNPPELATIGRQIETTPVPGYVGCCRAIQQLDLTERLGAIRVPTQILAGRDDPGMAPAVMEVIQERIPGSRLTIVSGAAHLLNVEQPEEANALLHDFFDARG